jgi:signal transduction histidine kinase
MVYLGVMGPLLLAIASLLALCIGGFSVLSSVRAYVGGESMWSKARASAVANLRLHAVAGRAADYRRFVEALAVPLGDRTARTELDKPRGDDELIRAGLLAGENAAEDIPGMMRLYRYFRHVEFMEEAIGAWAEGDRLIEQLQELGARIHAHVARGDPPAAITPLMVELDILESKLVNVEKYFSSTLGRASRKTGQLLVAVTLTLAALLALGGVLYTRRAMRMQMEDRQLLMEANQRFELGADAAGIGLFNWHAADDSFDLDERACALYGMSCPPDGINIKRSELRRRTLPEDQVRVRTDFEAAVTSGETLHMRFRIHMGDDKVRHLEAIGRMRDMHDPSRARMVGVLRDVGSEVVQAQLTVDKEAAERAARLRVEFLSRLSHELRTPLNAVLGVAQLLRIDPSEPLSVNQAKRVQILEESGAHLLRLVEDVLDITRIDSGALKLDMVPTDLLGMVRTALNIVEPERAAHEIRIEDRMPYRQAMVMADPQRLQQVFVNLLDNACKYNARGGLLWLEFSEEERDFKVSVGDQGAGLTQAQMGEIFQPFKRVSGKNDVSGTGLGLVVVKLLVAQMQGSVTVESQSGQGSVFTVRMPRLGP